MCSATKGTLRIVCLVLVSLAAGLGPALTNVRAVTDMEEMDECAGDMMWMLGWCIGSTATDSEVSTSFATGQVSTSSATAGAFATIDVPFAGARATRAFGINPTGDIVGSYDEPLPENPTLTRTRGFLLRNGEFTSIDYPGAAFTEAWGINARGDIVGRYRLVRGSAAVFGFLLRNGRFSDISIDNHVVTLPTKIGASEEIVGCYHDANTLNDMYAYVQRGSEVVSFALPSIPYPAGSAAMHNGITPGGRIVVGLAFETEVPARPGIAATAYGYVVTDGVLTRRLDFETPGFKSTFTQAWDINPRGTIVGQYVDAARITRGFYLDESGYVPIGPADARMTAARGINPQGDIVGLYTDASGRTHGFLLSR
jgi:uncharacterized membrane protein